MTSPIFISSNSNALLHFLPLNKPSRNTFTGIVFIITTQGEAMVEVDGHTHTLNCGTLLTLLPSHLLHTTECNNNFQCLTLAFTFDSMADFPYMIQSSIPQKIESTPTISLLKQEQDRLENWHQLIACHYELNTHPSYREILHSLIFIFTAEISTIYSGKPVKQSASHSEELTDSFFKLLHQYFRTNRETKFYATKLCTTSKYLSKVISMVTGHLPSYWISDFIVRETKTLLKSTPFTVTQISEQFNFPNSSFFARYFKRHTGIAPQEYRTDL